MENVTFKPKINKEAPKKSIDLDTVNKHYTSIQTKTRSD